LVFFDKPTIFFQFFLGIIKILCLKSATEYLYALFEKK